ncbi:MULTISPECIES: hypothetical protein [Marinobacter]|uniref:hypothetical protein n=1 Tax=Marinobacter TaxID=2742 RepID=UPI000DAEB376|nr:MULTISPECIES: hypothetical protein [Marinobacter]
MLNTPASRLLIALAITLFVIGSSLSQPSDLAVDQALVSGVSFDLQSNPGSDSPPAEDPLLITLSIGLFLLVARQLLGATPRPAIQARSVYYPVQPQGPPAQH